MDNNKAGPALALADIVFLSCGALASGVCITLVVCISAGWMTFSDANVIYWAAASCVPLTVAQFFRVRGQLLQSDKSLRAAQVITLVVIALQGVALVAFCIALYVALAADALGARSPVAIVFLTIAVIAVSIVAAWATKRHWHDPTKSGSENATEAFFAVLIYPLMLGLFGFAAEFTLLMLLERFGNAEPLRQFISASLLRSTAIASAGVLTLAWVIHIVRKSRGNAASYSASVSSVGFAVIYFQIVIMALIGLTGGMPR